MIDGVGIGDLSIIPDSRGMILHGMRKDSLLFSDFNLQEIYFSLIYPGVIKGWHRHKVMTLNYIVPVGMIKLVLYDDRPDSPSQFELEEIYLGRENYKVVRIPPGVWNGFIAVGDQAALVVNMTDRIHSVAEIERVAPKNFQHIGPVYDWFESNQG